MSEAIEQAVAKLNAIALELSDAKEHASIASQHFEGREVPRGCAHAFAVRGHLVTALRLLDEVAVTHASRAQTL